LHDKYDPARYFLLFWGGQIILIYSIFHNSFSFIGYGLAFISIACLMFSLGTLSGRLIGVGVTSKSNSYILKSKRALLFLKISLLMSFINALYGIYKVGFSLSQIVSFKILLELNNTAAVSRYTDGSSSNIISQITLIFVYLSPLLGGYLLPLISRKSKIWSYLTILPPLITTLTQAVKLGFITSIMLFIIGVIVSTYANNKTLMRIRGTTFLKIIFYSFLFFAVLFLSMVFRTGKFDIQTIKAIGEKFINYAFGHLPAFDLWFSENIESIKPSGGIKTFYGISNFLGIAERKQGIFTEYAIYGKNSFSGLKTNVYTVFRFIIEDFGLYGALLAIFISGTISGFSWLMIKKQERIFLFQTILTAVFFFVSWSFVASVWAYTSYIAIIIFFYLFLKLTFSKQKITELHAQIVN